MVRKAAAVLALGVGACIAIAGGWWLLAGCPAGARYEPKVLTCASTATQSAGWGPLIGGVAVLLVLLRPITAVMASVGRNTEGDERDQEEK